MFDFRYHVASLTAVFVALIIGILVGVGISGTGFVKESERENLNNVIDDLRADRDSARAQRDVLVADAAAAEAFVDEAYPLVMDRRLLGTRVAIVSIGAIPARLEGSVLRALTDADATLVRTVVLSLPSDMGAVSAALRRRPALEDAVGNWARNGRDLGRELVTGADDVLGALAPVVVEERTGTAAEEVDAVVVVGPPPPPADTRRGDFLRGLYGGLAGAGPAVALESREAQPPRVTELAPFGFATVDNADTALGRVSLAVVLSGLGGTDTEGSRYGVKETAEDGPLPPIEPLPADAGG